jgi:hypothetical protein
MVGAMYGPQTLTASGGTSPYKISLAKGSTLPGGLKFSTDNTSVTLTGTPTAGGSSFTFSFQITDSAKPPASNGQQYTLTISAPTIALSPSTLTAATVGKSYSQKLTASGGTAPYKNFKASSAALPAGLKLSTAGVLSGKPTAAGSFMFTVTVQDSSTGSGPYTSSPQQYTLTVGAPTITLSPTTTLLSARAAAPYSQAIGVKGGTAPYKFSIFGSLPAGVAFNKNTGVLSGVPLAAGNSLFTIEATDSSTGTGAPFSNSHDYILTVQPPVPARVVFLTPVFGAEVNGTLPAFAVEVLDALNRPLAGAVVSLRLVPLGSVGPAGFSGGSAVAAANGVATFRAVAVYTRGLYRIEADSGSVAGLSNAFSVSLDSRHSP